MPRNRFKLNRELLGHLDIRVQINNVNPFEWLRDILSRIPSHSVNKLEELLPHKWASAK